MFNGFNLENDFFYCVFIFRTIIVLMFGISILVTFCCYTGLVVFATFYDCDPVLAKKIRKYDQILPYFIMKTASNIPALPGIFVSGVFSAALRYTFFVKFLLENENVLKNCYLSAQCRLA